MSLIKIEAKIIEISNFCDFSYFSRTRNSNVYSISLLLFTVYCSNQHYILVFINFFNKNGFHNTAMLIQIELIVNRTRTKNLHVLKRAVVSQKGKLEVKNYVYLWYMFVFQVCISGPAYWYDDWPRLIMFFELWREVHNAYFTIYVQSISKNVRMVLDHYEKLVYIIYEF